MLNRTYILVEIGFIHMIGLLENSQEQVKLQIQQFEQTATGRPITWFVDKQVATGVWREEEIAPEVLGLTRPLKVYRAPRKTNLITYDWHGDKKTFCPPMWWDLAIGSGACGLGCRSCFLMLTHRIKRDPSRHLLYDNLDDFVHAAEKWLKDPARRRQHTLGVGIDRSDSLLYEGVVQHVRSLAPLFSDPYRNRCSNKLILLTKTANTHYLADIIPTQRSNVVASFSLNPEPVADMWEGKWPDTGERITPPISKRLEAVKYAQDLGFEVRVRVDPILTPDGWEKYYEAFIAEVKSMGINFHYWTLGTYREKNAQLDGWRERWGLLPMEWQPRDNELVKDGTHRHLPEVRRIEIYTKVRDIIQHEFPRARVSLCKETHSVRRAVALCNADCNCLV
jgi:DNA repair photolyase